jgi:hypothetical protein
MPFGQEPTYFLQQKHPAKECNLSFFVQGHSLHHIVVKARSYLFNKMFFAKVVKKIEKK